MEQEQQSHSSQHSQNEVNGKTHDSSDEGEEDDGGGGGDGDGEHLIDSTLLDWIKVNKLTFIKEILLQQEISLTEIASLSHPQRRQFVDSLQIENPIFEKRLLNAVLKLNDNNNINIEIKYEYINNAIKNVNDCMDVLNIQMINNQKQITKIYDQVIEKANKYKQIALNTTSQVYETKFAVLNVKLNKFKKIQQKISEYKENPDNVMNINDIISFKESGNVMDMIQSTDIIRIKITNNNIDEYIKNILCVNDLNSIIFAPKISINDIYQDSISINIFNEIKDSDLNITKYELKYSEQGKEHKHHHLNALNNGHSLKYNTKIINVDMNGKKDGNLTQYILRNLKSGTNYVISARLYSSLLSKWSVFCKNIHIKTNKYINYGGRVILKNMNDPNKNISFINCIIHCLSNTYDLRDYFISLKYINDLNKNNNDDNNNNLANIFGNILINIWSNRYDTISHSLSQLLMKNNFNNDPFKFLVFLLEKLHCNLNINIMNDKSLNNNNSNKRIIDDVLAWKAYIHQNKSRIIDLFHGQYRSDITCLQCKKHCIKYGIYSYLSLPINRVNKKSFIIDIFHRGYSDYSIDDNGYNNNMNKPVRHIFHCSANGTIKDLAKIIAKKYGVKRPFVLFYENNNMRVSREYEHKMLIKTVPNDKAFSCYILKDWNKEITAEEVKMKKISLWLARLCHIGPISSSNNNLNNQLFGMPFVLSFISIHTKYDIYKHVYERLYIWLGIEYLPKPPKISTKQQPEEIENEMKTYESDWNHILYKQLPFKLRLIENGIFDFNDNDVPSEIPINDTVFDSTFSSKHIDIIIEWKSNNIYQRVKKVMNKVLVDPEYSKWKKREQRNDNKRISIYDCIDSYTLKKRIGADQYQYNDVYIDNNNNNNINNLHYCSRCKKKQKYTKKIDLYTFPKYLIIHLQRDNNDKYVECPLDGLNLTKYQIVKKKKKKSSIDMMYQCQSDGVIDIDYKQQNGDNMINNDHYFDELDGMNGYNMKPAPIYNLYAVASNTNTNNNDFSAYIKTKDSNQWYDFNDTQITLIHQSQVISPSSYILFYKKTF